VPVTSGLDHTEGDGRWCDPPDDAIKGYEKLLTVNANETGAEIADILHDAKWKVEKLKWLSNLQKEREELPAVPAATKAHG